MKTLLLIINLFLVSNPSFASTHTQWSYSNAEGPDHWSTLSSEYRECSAHNQSPINLSGFLDTDLKAIEINYKTDGNEIINNGHTIQVNYAKGSSIVIDNDRFELKQFHFHTPSENHINGKEFPLEAHFVHSDKNGNLAVIALMLDIGNENKTLAQALSKLPEHTGDKFALTTKINAENLLPANQEYYRFNGSLTTPPCSEGVRWFVMKKAVSLSKDQLKLFQLAIHEPNNRPIQMVNARLILE